MKTEFWGDTVTVVSGDMRQWSAPELADIIVSELLGSFGDNELSPECLDGAQHYLKGHSLICSFDIRVFVLLTCSRCRLLTVCRPAEYSVWTLSVSWLVIRKLGLCSVTCRAVEECVNERAKELIVIKN